MVTKILSKAVLAVISISLFSATAFAEGKHSQLFHAFILEGQTGINDSSDSTSSWELDGWYGGDYNKLWLKSEGEIHKSTVEDAEVQALYSRNIHNFWDAQVGIRHDIEPDATTYAVIGVNGLAPYFFETEAHLFLSEDGDVTARIKQSNEFLVTQRLILEPYAEINLSAQDVPSKDIGTGLADGEVGLQTRYEYTRKFAPYVDINYGTKFGKTANLAEKNGEDTDSFNASIGLRIMF